MKNKKYKGEREEECHIKTLKIRNQGHTTNRRRRTKNIGGGTGKGITYNDCKLMTHATNGNGEQKNLTVRAITHKDIASQNMQQMEIKKIKGDGKSNDI